MQIFSIPVGVTKTITLQPVDSSVPPEPGTIQALPVPSWGGYDSSLLSVIPASDGLSAAVTGLRPNGSTVITNSFQNSNNVNVQPQVQINTLANPATGALYSIS
jgi:hypothetical protein